MKASGAAGQAPALFLFHPGVREIVRPGKSGRRPDGRLAYAVNRRAAVKDVIEALGAPHTEVGRILAGGREVGFGHILEPGQEVEVFAVPAPLDVTRPTFLRPEPLEGVLFQVDATCGKLARLLRLLGLDAAYDRNLDDAAVAGKAAAEGRIVLTMDRALLKRAQVAYGRLVRRCHPPDQLTEVLDFFGLKGPFSPFSRCLHCNQPLVPASKASVLHRLEPLTRKHFAAFSHCPSCDRVYWAGSHHERMLEWLRQAGVR